MRLKTNKKGNRQTNREINRQTNSTCKNSPTPGQEKRRAQFLGPGERGRNSRSRLAVPPGASCTVVSEHQNEEGELVGIVAEVEEY